MMASSGRVYPPSAGGSLLWPETAELRLGFSRGEAQAYVHLALPVFSTHPVVFCGTFLP